MHFYAYASYLCIPQHAVVENAGAQGGCPPGEAPLEGTQWDIDLTFGVGRRCCSDRLSAQTWCATGWVGHLCR